MQRVTALIVLAGAVLGTVLGAQGQGTPGRVATPSKGLIVGRVVDAASNAPISSVIVSLAGTALPSSIRAVSYTHLTLPTILRV